MGASAHPHTYSFSANWPVTMLLLSVKLLGNTPGFNGIVQDHEVGNELVCVDHVCFIMGSLFTGLSLSSLPVHWLESF